MKQYQVAWSFIDKTGVSRRAGEVVELETNYAMLLIGKGLIAEKSEKKQAAPENKAATPPENKTAKRTTKKD